MPTGRSKGTEEVAVVVCGGAAPPADRLPAGLAEAEWVVGADRGVDVARSLGLLVHLAVGDFDSVAPGSLDWVRHNGGVVEEHPAAKDETDLELALVAALARHPGRIVVIGGDGGRLDHLLANVALLAAPFLSDTVVTAHFATATLTVIRPGIPRTVQGRVGDLVSLMAFHGAARGVTTEGLQYPLRDEDLLAGSSRGTSNVLAAPWATVTIRHGVLVAIQPHRQTSPEGDQP